MMEGGMAGEREGATGRQPPSSDPARAAASEGDRTPADAGLTPSRDPALPPSAVNAIPPDEVLAWLDARESPPPPELRQRMAEALANVKSETVPGALAEGALACLEATVARPEERASALDLLAADALLTYALEAAADLGAETLRRIAEEYGPEALGRVLPEEPDQ